MVLIKNKAKVKRQDSGKNGREIVEAVDAIRKDTSPAINTRKL